MTLPATLNDRQFQSFVELGSSGAPARRVVLYDASGNALWSVATPADGQALAAAPTLTVQQLLYNGATLDLQRGNQQGTLLASATRTANTASADQTNYNARGVLLFLNVTAASGTGGVRALVQAKDPISGSTQFLASATPAFKTATGLYVYSVYPGAPVGAFLEQATQAALPRTWSVLVQHGDASSYTYSLGFALIV